MPATAADIPPEIIAHVVLLLAEEVRAAMQNDPNGIASKRTLGALCRTCRYWASRVRPHFFESVTLLSERHANTYFALLESRVLTQWQSRAGENLHLAQYVQRLTVTWAHAEKSQWLHRVFLNRHLLPNLKFINLRVTNSTMASEPDLRQSLRPVNHDLPRTLPHSVMACEAVIIQPVRVSHFREFLRVTGKIRASELNCQQLEWPDGDQLNNLAFLPPEVHSRTRFLPRKVTVSSDCEAVWPFLWCIFTTRLPNTIPAGRKSDFGCVPYLRSDTLKTLQQLVRAVTSVVSFDIYGDKVDKFGDQHRHALQLRETPPSNQLVISRLLGGFTKLDSLRRIRRYAPRLEVDVTAAGELTRIVIIFDPTAEWPPNMGGDIAVREEVFENHPWKELDEIASDFGTPLDALDVVALADSAHMHKMADTVEARMPAMSAARKLAFWYGLTHSDMAGRVDGELHTGRRTRLRRPAIVAQARTEA